MVGREGQIGNLLQAHWCCIIWCVCEGGRARRLGRDNLLVMLCVMLSSGVHRGIFLAPSVLAPPPPMGGGNG